MGELIINAINVNGLRDIKSSKAQTITLALKNKADITFLLDTRLDHTTETNVTNHWHHKCQFTHNQIEHHAGIAILYGNDKCKINNKIDDPQGRYVLLKIEIGKIHFLVVAVYAHATDAKLRKKFFKEISILIEDNKQDNERILLLGDFNTVENPSLDRCTKRTSKDHSTIELQRTLGSHDLEDLWRESNENTRQYTFCSNKNTFSRIDRAYTSKAHRSTIKQTQILPFTHSDHYMISVTLHTNTTPIKTGYWTHNNDLLEEQEYIDALKQVITTSIRQSKGKYTNILQRWDFIKKQIKVNSIKYNVAKINKSKQHHKKLSKSLKNISSKNDGATHTIAQIKNLEDQIREIEAEKVNKFKDYLKTQYVEEGEKCTKFFLNLANKKKMDTTMHELLIENNGPTRLSSDQDEMLHETKTFYTHLYSLETTIPQAQKSMLGKIDRTLTREQALECEGLFSEQELKTSINDLHSDKSPGPDGLSLEIFRICFEELKVAFLDMIIEVRYQETLSDSQKQASIVTLPKQGDLTLLKNWRPLSMLNTDYKILTKMLSNRLAKVLPIIIHEDHTCSVKGRVIQENLSIIRDIIYYANKTKDNIALVSLDQMKAFDKVDWNFLERILKKFNFGPDFIRWVRIIQTNITSSVKVNGNISEQFEIKQGVRQGCPLSPLLYLLYAEILAENIRKNEGIKGVKIDETEFKISLYADDTTLFLTGDDSFSKLDETLALFNLASGAVINHDKCQGLWLGANKNRQDKPLGFKWSSNVIKILGLYFGSKCAIEKNFQIVEEKFLKTLSLWKQRNLSLKGRVIVANQLAGSKLNYPAHILICPPPPTKY